MRYPPFLLISFVGCEQVVTDAAVQFPFAIIIVGVLMPLLIVILFLIDIGIDLSNLLREKLVLLVAAAVIDIDKMKIHFRATSKPTTNVPTTAKNNHIVMLLTIRA